MTRRAGKAPPIRSFSGRYDFLSNFYEHSFRWSGDVWRTAEHAFQAAKAAEPIDYFRIREAATPGKAKRMGRHCGIKPGWDASRVSVMADIVRAKFMDPVLRKKLLDTADAELVEGNGWGDTFWGVDLVTGEGQNQLGTILMATRAYYAQ